MKKLILRHNWCDPYVSSGTEIYPFEYSSKEDAFVDFNQAMEDTEYYEIEFCGRTFRKESDYDDYDFFDLDEWFENDKLTKS